jgi:hypothetical protein
LAKYSNPVILILRRFLYIYINIENISGGQYESNVTEEWIAIYSMMYGLVMVTIYSNLWVEVWKQNVKKNWHNPLINVIGTVGRIYIKITPPFTVLYITRCYIRYNLVTFHIICILLYFTYYVVFLSRMAFLFYGIWIAWHYRRK